MQQIAIGQTHLVVIQPGLHLRHFLLPYFQAIGFGVLQKLLGQVETADVFEPRVFSTASARFIWPPMSPFSIQIVFSAARIA